MEEEDTEQQQDVAVETFRKNEQEKGKVKTALTRNMRRIWQMSMPYGTKKQILSNPPSIGMAF